MPGEITKGQTVRLIDVFALGPFMVWAGTRRGSLPPWARFGLASAGVLTIVYNWIRYRANVRGEGPVGGFFLGAQPLVSLAVAAAVGAMAARRA